jgi:hypothetical protein
MLVEVQGGHKYQMKLHDMCHTGDWMRKVQYDRLGVLRYPSCALVYSLKNRGIRQLAGVDAL